MLKLQQNISTRDWDSITCSNGFYKLMYMSLFLLYSTTVIYLYIFGMGEKEHPAILMADSFPRFCWHYQVLFPFTWFILPHCTLIKNWSHYVLCGSFSCQSVTLRDICYRDRNPKRIMYYFLVLISNYWDSFTKNYTEDNLL